MSTPFFSLQKGLYREEDVTGTGSLSACGTRTSPPERPARYEDVVELKQPQPEVILAELHQATDETREKKDARKRTSLQRVRDHKAKREKEQDIVEDLHPQRNTLSKNPVLYDQNSSSSYRLWVPASRNRSVKDAMASSSTARLIRAAGCRSRLRNRTLIQCMKNTYSSTKAAINRSSPLYCSTYNLRTRPPCQTRQPALPSSTYFTLPCPYSGY